MTSTSEPKPQRRTRRLITRPVDGGEIIAFDLSSQQVASLDADTARVFGLADGSRDIAAIATELSMTPDDVAAALARLDDADLLAEDQRGVFTRRALIVGGAAVAFVPLMAVPAPAVGVMRSSNPTVVASQAMTITTDPNHPSSYSGYQVTATGFLASHSLTCTCSYSAQDYYNSSGQLMTGTQTTTSSPTGSATFYWASTVGPSSGNVTFTVSDGTHTVTSNTVQEGG